MSDAPLSEVCVCGTSHWHTMVDRIFWCRRCGCIRLIFERYWRVPYDRIGDLSSAVIIEGGNDGPPTVPGTPIAKKREQDDDDE
jgi:hypothetical protein